VLNGTSINGSPTFTSSIGAALLQSSLGGIIPLLTATGAALSSNNASAQLNNNFDLRLFIIESSKNNKGFRFETLFRDVSRFIEEQQMKKGEKASSPLLAKLTVKYRQYSTTLLRQKQEKITK
jgi:hypothetical protein